MGPPRSSAAAEVPERRATFRDIGATWLRILAAAGVVAVIMAISGGFGAGGPTIVSRIIYWLILVAIGATIGVLLGVFVMPRDWFDRRPILCWSTIALVLWPPMSVASALAQSLAGGRPFNLALIWLVAPSSLATTAALTILAFMVRRRGPVETHAGPKDAPPPKFLDRLPGKLAGAELWAVEAEDHYLRLHTSLGSDLILMRLGDAISELEGIEGARTHRSWWVAREAVKRVERDDGRAILHLPDGAEAPVSRAYAKVLRAAGWF